MEENSSTATPTPAETPQAPAVSTNPNELDFEMTPEQEQEYVDQILKDGNYTPPVEEAPEEPDTPEVPETPETPIVPEKPEPEAPETPETPAEITAPQTDDLWIEVERVVTDDLGEETTETVKLVYDPTDPSSFIPEDFQAKSIKQLADIMDAKNEMAKLYEERLQKYSDEKSTEAAANLEKEMLAGWEAERQELVKAGALEEPKLKERDEGYDKDPAVVKTEAVYKFMIDKNAERVKDGIPPIKSFALAFTMYENAEATKAAADAEKKAEEETKIKGAMIGGSSAASGGTAEQAAYKAGSHKSIWDVPVED